MNLSNIVRRALLAGLGAQERVREFIDELVKRGELSKSQGAKIVKDWAEKADKRKEKFSRGLSEIVAKALEKMNLPTKNDIEELHKKVDTLSKRLEGEKKN